MSTTTVVGLFFIALAGLFAGLAFRDYLKGDGGSRQARKTWLLMSLIFFVVSAGLIII
jgi:hypothetical protein